MSVVAHARRPFYFQGRSFLAFVLTPGEPLEDWWQELEAWIDKTPDFFSSRPIILNLSRVSLTKPELAGFLAQLQTRQFRLISVEGIDPAWLGPGLEPLPGGKAPGSPETTDDIPEANPPDIEESEPEVNSLLLNAPVRSGQSVYFPVGDVTVAGSVASGAEIVSGGSIHIYGTLRGRVFAGSTGNAQARIFCQRFEAELLVIGGYYKSPEDIDPELYGRPVQAWLEGSQIIVKEME